jgi:hypothetical protein
MMATIDRDKDLEVSLMAAPVRRISILIAAIAAAAILAPVGTAGTAGSRQAGLPAYPTLYVKYTMNCTFSIFNDEGARITSIPPGVYQVEVSTPIMFKLVFGGGEGVDHLVPGDMTGCRGWVQFQLTGPGISQFTTLDAGCYAFGLLPAQTFQAGQTYIFQDLNQPAVTRTALTVQGAGTPTAPVSPYGPTSGKGEVSKDLVGSQIEEVRSKGATTASLKGALAGRLSVAGKPTLTYKGKPVSSLKAGRYKITVLDETGKNGFTIKNGKQSVNVTGVPFLGRKSVTVTLKAGEWTYSSGLGKPQRFRVIA